MKENIITEEGVVELLDSDEVKKHTNPLFLLLYKLFYNTNEPDKI